jgi:hypothetical protein
MQMSFTIVLLAATIWVIKQRRMRRTERVASVGETKSADSALVGEKVKETGHWET